MSFFRQDVRNANASSVGERGSLKRASKAPGGANLKRSGQRHNAGLRELPILDELQNGSNISQRALADRLRMAVGAVNRYLRDMIRAGYIEVANRSVRPFAYRLTRAGDRYRRRLSHDHYHWLLGNLRVVERRITAALGELQRHGVRRVVFYGAGDVMEATHRLATALGLKVVGVVDDDVAKRGLTRAGLVVQEPATINRLAPDAVVITTFRHARAIRGKMDRALRSSMIVGEL